MTDRRTFPLGGIILAIVPLAALVAGFAVLSSASVSAGDWDRYERYREFWGGNPAEVYSHWLDMVLMSGNAAAIAWLLSAEVLFRRNRAQNKWLVALTYACAILGLILSGAIALVLDRSHGEGTVLLAYPILFLPVLGSSYYLLRQSAALVHWKFTAVVVLSGCYAALHTAAQLYYEPSGTGGPSLRIVPVWLSSVGLALIWAFVQGIRTGRLRRFIMRVGGVVRKPIVWGGGTFIVLAVGIPVTIHAHRLHNRREQAVLPWLNELETRLSDAFVADLKRDHVSPKPALHEKIPVSAAAHTLLDDRRIKDGNSLRIYVPVSQTDYVFLWGNDHFEFCDIRELRRGATEEIDQGFIDALIAHGGTYQTGLYSILWSPHIAGRVIKDATGAVKAICVINSP